MQKILVSLSFLLSSFAVAAPDCMVGYGICVYKEQADLVEVMASLSDAKYRGFTGGEIDVKCRKQLQQYVYAYAATGAKVTKLVMSDVGKSTPGKLYGTVETYHTTLRFIFTNHDGKTFELAQDCSRKM